MAEGESGPHKSLILLVEDDAFLRSIFSRKLQDSSFDLITVDNGEDALQTAREKKPDVILLDLNLPGMNGFEVLKAVRSNETLKDALILILTNSVLNEDVIKSNELKADDFLTKANFSMDEIIERIENHVAKRAIH